MSVTLNISVNRDEVYREVDKITGYTGKKDSEDGSSYERIATIEENEEILQRYFNEACTTISDVIKRYVSESPSLGFAEYSAVLSMPTNWDASMSSSVNESVKTCIIDHICCKWMRLVKSEEETKYATDAASALMEVRNKLAHIKKPSRSSYI